MKILNEIKNIITQDYDKIRNNTLLNCHTIWLHSIVLSNKNWLLTRVFLTDKNHDMRKNNYENWLKEKLSIAIHPHHVSLNIYPIKWIIYNILFSTNIVNSNIVDINKYKWVSKILNWKWWFEFLWKDEIYFIKKELITENNCQTCTMEWQELHTIYVPKWQESAWIITELSENKNYNWYNYSNYNLSQRNDDGLYKKANDVEFKKLLCILGI